MRRMASPSSGATVRTVRRPVRLASDTAMEFVTTTSSRGEDLMRSIAGPDSTAWTPHARMRRAPSRASASTACTSVLAVHVADQVHGDRLVRAFATLVDDGQAGLEPLGDGAGTLYATGVGRDDDGIVQILLAEVVDD